MSDLPEIDSVREGWGMDRFTPVIQGKDFFDNYKKCRDEGERIQLFIETASREDIPLKAIEELLKQKDEFFLAMGLQCFGHIKNSKIKESLKNIEHIEGIDDPWELIQQLPNPDDYKCHSLMIFEMLCEKAKSGNDLISLSAAYAICKLGYERKDTSRYLDDTPQDIQEDIFIKNLEFIQKKSINNDANKYKKCVKFWLYAPKFYLLNMLRLISSSNSKLVEDILKRLGITGVEFVIQEVNPFPKFVVKIGLDLASDLLINQKYQDKETKNRLSKVLIPILNHEDINLRRLAAQAINDVCSCLQGDIKAQAAVICRDWNKVVELGEVSIPFLLEAIRGNLLLDTTANYKEQIKALQCISKIYRNNTDKKIEFLSIFLQHDLQDIRDATLVILEAHKNRLDTKSAYIFKALDFKFKLEKLSIYSLTLSEISREIQKMQNYQDEVESVFDNAISSCMTKATGVKNFLSGLQASYLGVIDSYIKELNKQQKQDRKQKEEARNEIIYRFIFAASLVIFSIWIFSPGGLSFLSASMRFIVIASCFYMLSIVPSFMIYLVFTTLYDSRNDIWEFLGHLFTFIFIGMFVLIFICLFMLVFKQPLSQMRSFDNNIDTTAALIGTVLPTLQWAFPNLFNDQ
jgi:hypothetical protein